MQKAIAAVTIPAQTNAHGDITVCVGGVTHHLIIGRCMEGGGGGGGVATLP